MPDGHDRHSPCKDSGQDMLSRHQTSSPSFAGADASSSSITVSRRRRWLLGASLSLPVIVAGAALGPSVLTFGRTVPWPRWGAAPSVPTPLRGGAAPSSGALRQDGAGLDDALPAGSTILPGGRIRLTFF